LASGGANFIDMDEPMDPRISTVESDIAGVRASVEAMQASTATNLALVEAENRLQAQIVKTRYDLERKIDQAAADLKVEFYKMAIDTRSWTLATAVGLFVAFGGMIFGLVKYLAP
jgi:hypothetical protein